MAEKIADDELTHRLPNFKIKLRDCADSRIRWKVLLTLVRKF